MLSRSDHTNCPLALFTVKECLTKSGRALRISHVNHTARLQVPLHVSSYRLLQGQPSAVLQAQRRSRLVCECSHVSRCRDASVPSLAILQRPPWPVTRAMTNPPERLSDTSSGTPSTCEWRAGRAHNLFRVMFENVID